MTDFYINNTTVFREKTRIVRGNTVSDIEGNDVVGIQIDDIDTVRAKENKCLRINSRTGSAIGFKISDCTDALLCYNVASRCKTGFEFNNISNIDIYNLTAHNCNICVKSDSTVFARNIVLSAYEDWARYKANIGFQISSGFNLNIDHFLNWGIGDLYQGGNVNEGDTIYYTLPLYVDEPNDDLTPDHISKMINIGTDNPLNTDEPCLGGIESQITNEITAAKGYEYELIDNSFWDVENSDSAEMIFIRVFQSRILANAELAEQQVERDYYIKTAESLLGFSELYPMYARYASSSKFKKRVMDMWFAGQNPSTLSAYNNAIGGYNLFPSFFKRFEDWDSAWVLGESVVAVDNWIVGVDAQRFGMAVDVLGTMTMSQETSGECYNNTQKSVSDVAPVCWTLHNEPQPSGYVLFSDLYNRYNYCVLNNMIYNDDFGVSIEQVQNTGTIITPAISTLTLGTSGEVELSVLDRIYSDSVTRNVYYRQSTTTSFSDDWTSITKPIGEIIELYGNYIQFKIVVEHILREIDYEFLGLALRVYTTAKDWTQQV